MIIVISYPADKHAAEVISKLEKLHQDSLLLDISEIGNEWHTNVDEHGKGTLSVIVGRMVSKIHFDEINSLWLRRKTSLDDKIQGSTQKSYIERERGAFVEGLALILNNKFRLNSPQNSLLACRKTYQLTVAKSVGFLVPKTYFGNNPIEALEFISGMGEYTLVKPIDSGFIPKGEVGNNQPLVIYAKKIKSDLLASSANRLAICPAILQECINKVSDIRITVVKNKVFAAKIRCKHGDEIDSRHWKNNGMWEIFGVPNSTRSKIMSLMNALNLEFGCIDMVEDFAGNLYFLEINPGGQWLFMERAVGHPISNEIALVPSGLTDDKDQLF